MSDETWRLLYQEPTFEPLPTALDSMLTCDVCGALVKDVEDAQKHTDWHDATGTGAG